jgi:SAM-dependent methyltransferase
MMQPAPSDRDGPDVDYEGHDLEAMACAPNYTGWIRDEFALHLRGRVAEVGAGTGTFTAALLGLGLERIVAIEPAPSMHARVAARYAGERRVATFHGTLADVVASGERFDAVVYNNVLEHIGDDAGELAQARDALRPGGALLVFSPALPCLMSDFDRSVGHVRRYRKAGLGTLARDAGFRVERLHYVDIAGIVPWYLFMVLGRGMLDPRKVGTYDRLVVPIVRRLERLVRPPIGRNVMLVARNPG